MVRRFAVPLVDVTRLPGHVAIVMDGNGRWAQRHELPRTEGHEKGSESVRRVVRTSRRLGIPTLTLFAFSEQNWARSATEVQALMELLRRFLIEEREEMLENGIKLRPVGRVHKLPSRVREVLDPLCEESAHLDGMTLNLCLSYGGREEIGDAARSLARRVAEGHLDPEAVDEAMLDAEMPSVAIGPVDLLIRTGGEHRISNFVLWAAAYAELHFAAQLWPDYSEADLFDALADFQRRERRYGRVPSDLEPPGSAHPLPAGSRVHA